jgi:hypothetical protein
LAGDNRLVEGYFMIIIICSLDEIAGGSDYTFAKGGNEKYTFILTKGLK